MKRERLRCRTVVLTILTVMGVMLLGGCAPIDSGTLSTFVRELLLNLSAAVLL